MKFLSTTSNSCCRHLRVAAALSMLLTLLPAWGVEASGAKDVPEFYSRWQTLTTEELFAKGRHFISEDVKLDSALVCYTVVANRLRDHLSADNASTYARALNNIGYLFYTHYNDYAQADALFDEAIELSTKYDISEQLPYLYLNKGNISYLFESLNGVEQSLSHVIDNSKRTFHYSVEQQAWSCATPAFYSMAVFSLIQGNTTQIADEAKTFATLNIPQGTPQLDACQAYLKVLEAHDAGDLGRCTALLQDIIDNDAPDGYDHFNRVVNASTTLAHLLTRNNQKGRAKAVLDHLHVLVDGSSSIMAQVIAYGMMQRFYVEQGDSAQAQHYEYLKLRAKNELQEEHNLADIGQNRFLRQLNHVNEDLKAEQEANFWKSVVLLIVSVAFVVIAIVLVLLVRSNRQQRRYTDYLYEQNLRLLNTNQLLVDQETPPVEPAAAPAAAAFGAASDPSLKAKAPPTEAEPGADPALIASITDILSQTDVICQPDFSLSTLCNLTGYNHTYMSQAIRQEWATNFNGLLNSYRIKEACRRMNDVEHYGNLTIEAIATGVGYASRSHFSTLFKKVTGITAADYIKRARRKATTAKLTV